MIPQWVKNKEKLTNYLVNVSDSKFDNVTQIIGNGFENSKAYLITNRPIGEGNYIQNGRRHTVLGMEYDNQAYGFQVSFAGINVLYRKKENGNWGNWQSLTTVVGTFPTLLNSWVAFFGNSNTLIKTGNVVTLTMSVKSGTTKSICQLPAGFCPKNSGYFPVVNLTDKTSSVFFISHDGYVQTENNEVGKSIFANVSFLTN